MLALQAYGHSVGWGFQLQEPIFVGLLAALLLLLALSLFGVFEMGTSVMALAGKANTRLTTSALTGSFFSGILATAVATPCTGPFLGSAVGFAVTLPEILWLCIFTSLGLGMVPESSWRPFPRCFVLCQSRALDVRFKELMGFVMLATVLWLVWVFAAQTNRYRSLCCWWEFCFSPIGGWIYGRWGSPFQGKTTRIMGMSATALCMLMAAYTIFTATSPVILALEGIPQL